MIGDFPKGCPCCGTFLIGKTNDGPWLALAKKDNEACKRLGGWRWTKVRQDAMGFGWSCADSFLARFRFFVPRTRLVMVERHSVDNPPPTGRFFPRKVAPC